MQSFLIVGGTKKERKEKIEKLIEKFQVKMVDQIIIGQNQDQSLGIEKIRSLQHQLQFKPYSSNYKIAVIVGAERLTIPAQNALLKILEEPPQKTMIVLSSQNSESFLETILSRCQIIRLATFSQIEIDEKVISSQLPLLKAILKAGVGERMQIADKLAKDKESALVFCQAQLIIWRKKLLQEKRKEKREEILKIIRQIKKTFNYLQANVNPKLALENLLQNYPSGNT